MHVNSCLKPAAPDFLITCGDGGGRRRTGAPEEREDEVASGRSDVGCCSGSLRSVRLAAAVAMCCLVTAACDGSDSETARKESTTTSAVSSTSPAETSFASDTFTTSVDDFVRRFNDQRLVLEAAGFPVGEVAAQQVDQSLCGSRVTEAHSVYVLGPCTSDAVRGVFVVGDAAGDAGLHRRLLLVSCGVVLPPAVADAASISFLNRVLPELEDEADGLVVEFDPYYDVHVVVDRSTVGYLCVPPGAEAAPVGIPSS